jgi:hypothetical protein
MSLAARVRALAKKLRSARIDARAECPDDVSPADFIHLPPEEPNMEKRQRTSLDSKQEQRDGKPLEAHVASAPSAISRRTFLGGVGGATAALTAGGVILPALSGASRASAAALPPLESDAARKQHAFTLRVNTARNNFAQPLATHPSNGDETLYASKIGSFSKGLPHNAFGEVDLTAYDALLHAVDTGAQADFDAVPTGCADPSRRLKLVNPLSGLAFDMEGLDAHDYTQIPAPAFASAEEAGEIVENYWMALLRDVPFSEYATNATAQAAARDLSAMSDFHGPKIGGQVTTQSLFRVNFPGALLGPWVSQFFWRTQPFGAQHIEPRMRTGVAGLDYMTTVPEWLDCQNGIGPLTTMTFDPTLRYIRNGRDMSQWVHMDVLYQAYFQAALILMTPPDPSDPFTGGGMGAPHNVGDPYHGSPMQIGFGTFGGPYFMAIVTEVATRALKAVWFQKWFVHRRLRPEAFAGAIQQKLVNGLPYPIHLDVLNSAALAAVNSHYGNSLLPMAFPEGCPIHPAYGAGHATVAGACITILKALFDENYVIPNPVVPTSDGLALVPYTGADAGQLTVGSELNKLGMNVAFGRNIAGVHWRSDGLESLKLGEAVAISVLRDQRRTYAENFHGFTFTRFDGTPFTI